MTEPYPWFRIYNRIKAQIPAAPDAVIRQEIWSTVDDFTADTNIWIEEVPLAVTPDITTYNIMPLITSGYPSRLMLVWNDQTNDPRDRYHWASGGITMRVPGVLELIDVPTTAASWVAAIAKTPNTERLVTIDPPTDPPTYTPTGYPEIDDWIIYSNADTIYYGTMHFLQRQPSKPYGNEKAARENGMIYQSAKSTARVNAMRGNVFGAQAWRFPQTFATRRKGWV
jgi:hypothetical protein